LEDWKIKVSMLWLIAEFIFAFYILFSFMEPGLLQQFLSTGEVEGMKMTPVLLLFFAAATLVPLIMAFLSLTLKDSTDRWANVIVGIVYAATWFFDLAGALAILSVWRIIMLLSGIIALLLVAWYAWKSKKKA
jgi:hypothetical protein